MDWFITTLNRWTSLTRNDIFVIRWSISSFSAKCEIRTFYIYLKRNEACDHLSMQVKIQKILHIRWTIFVASREQKKRIYRSKERRFSAEMRLFAFFEVMFHSRAMVGVKKLRPALWRYVYVLYQSNNGSLGAVESRLHAGLDLHAIFKCEDLRYEAGKQILMPAYDEPPFQVCYWK